MSGDTCKRCGVYSYSVDGHECEDLEERRSVLDRLDAIEEGMALRSERLNALEERLDALDVSLEERINALDTSFEQRINALPSSQLRKKTFETCVLCRKRPTDYTGVTCQECREREERLEALMKEPRPKTHCAWGEPDCNICHPAPDTEKP